MAMARTRRCRSRCRSARSIPASTSTTRKIPVPGEPRPNIEVVELDERARGSLARRHPELLGRTHAYVVATTADQKEKVFEALKAIAETINRSDRLQLEELIATLVRIEDGPRPDLIEAARHQARMRSRLLHDFGAFSATELADIGGSSADNRSQLGYRWRRKKRVFAVTH